MLRSFLLSIKKILKLLSDLQKSKSFTPAYRIVEITQTETDEHIVTIQIINKSVVFQTKPEEILSNDNLVDLFSPRDVRALTYLGYLSLNNPKYKILAQRLSEENDKVLFALRKRGEKKVVVKTADEILNEKEILNNLNAQDAHTVGYTVASESVINEKKLKEAAKNNSL